MIPASDHSPESKKIQSDGRLLATAKGMLIGLTAFFFLASLAQLAYLHRQIEDIPDLNVTALVSEQIKNGPPKQSLLPLMELESRTALEEYAIKRRYHQGNVLLMSRIWISYLSFVTGMILSLVGASFILSKIREPVTKLDADGKIGKLSIASSSPGIILAVLGVMLIITSILTNHRIAVKDQAIYLNAYRPTFRQAIPSNHTETIASENENALEKLDKALE